jgi:23S rRNA pseudouridine2605 synthase
MPRKTTPKTPKKNDGEKPKKSAPRKPKKSDAEVPALPPGPGEPELDLAVEAGLDAELVSPRKSATPVVVDPEAELIAGATDTFEQAFEEREPVERPEPIAADLESPRLEEAPEAPHQEEPDQDEADEDEPDEDEPDENEFEAEEPGSAPSQPARMERLQKILSQAGVASRRHAEEMITEGRVQVNGKVVTELGSKADPQRDHIRVDGKLIHGAERLRYFVLNKPKGYVTTVSDPEGRPTVMEFFKKAGERLYPVGRLDFHSEGLLLVTNDGDLANKLTKAATGVEKTYLVKVSGQPTEEELDRLREGVGIDRGRPGEGRVQTSPATIREARSGDNPWYEVVLTEGRNRELRKMFEEIGHHVEKIRRVGYGPLILDVEPGQFRELDADELAKLRLAAEGKWRKPKPREPKRDTGRQAGYGKKLPPAKQFGPAKQSGPARQFGPAKQFGAEKKSAPARNFGPSKQFGGTRPPADAKKFGAPQKFGSARPFGAPQRSAAPPRFGETSGPGRSAPQRPPMRDARSSEGARPRFQGSGPRPAGRREEFPRRDVGAFKPQRPRPGTERQAGERAGSARADRPGGGFAKKQGDRPAYPKKAFDRPRSDKPRFDKPRSDNRASQENRGAQRPPRGPMPSRPFESSRPSAPSRFARREAPSGGGYRGSPGAGPRAGSTRPAGSPPAGRNTGRSNRPPAAGRGPGRPSRPPFKGTSGAPKRGGPSRPGSNRPRGQGRRPE